MHEVLFPGSLVSRTGLRSLLGHDGKPLSRQAVHQIAAREDFPAPIDVLDDGRTPIWGRASVERWREERARAR